MGKGKIYWMIMALMVAAISLQAQGWRSGNGPLNGYGYGNGCPAGYCIEFITDLSTEQQEKITEMEETHQEAMAELREKRRSTTDVIEKNDIRGEMLRKVKAHREAVKGLLTEEQQKEFEMLHARNNYRGNGRGYARGRGRGPCQAGFNRPNGYGRQGYAGKGRRGGWNCPRYGRGGGF